MNESFAVNNQKLRGVFILPKILKDKNPAVLFIHGLTSQKENSFQYANGLAKLGCISFLFDMRGHGESEGDINALTLKDFLEDVVAAYDFLEDGEGIDKDNVSVVGSSLGGYLAALLTSKRKVKNLALRAPADYPKEVFHKPTIAHGGENPSVMEWRRQLKKPDNSFALQAMHAFDGKVLIIESENDDMVPHATIENYGNAIKDKTKLTHIVVQGAPHSMKEGKFRDEVAQMLVGWFGALP